MPGSGAIGYMVSTIRNNRKLLRKKSMFKKERTFLSLTGQDYKSAEGKVAKKKLSSNELRRIKERTLKEAQKDTNRAIIVATVLAIPLLFLFSLWINDNESATQSIEQAKQEEYFEKNLNEYLFLLEDGDRWLEENRLKNAVYRYEQAVALLPEVYEGHYRLAMAYSYNCVYQSKNCEKAEKLTKKLEELFPDKSKQTNLKLTLTTTK